MKPTAIPNTVMRNVAIAFLVVLCASCAEENRFPYVDLGDRESFLDGVVHIEPELVMEVPFVERWCDRLDLKKHSIDVGDAKLYVEEEGKGMPMVLINGGPGGTHHCFHPWLSKLKEHARVIYYDQRGCGLSDFEPGEDGYSVRQAVADLDAIRKTLNVDKWVILGYSYGGFLAQYYTVHHPENVAGLILLGSVTGMRVNTGKSRQDDYMSQEEKTRLDEIKQELKQVSEDKGLPPKEYIQLLIYNKHLNGDWKRQSCYKPSRERLAEKALYEWDHDEDFNSILNRSKRTVDLKGFFDSNPIPTLILEGKYDLTWGGKKRGILQRNHPNARMILFEKAGHKIYSEEPEHFFSELGGFIENLPEVSEEEISVFKASLEESGHER